MTYRWTGAHAFRDHANDRVIEPGEELPEDVAEQVVAAHPHDVERVDDDEDGGDGDHYQLLDPTEYSVDDLEAELEQSDYSATALEEIHDAEKAGDSRTTALEVIDDAIDEARK